MHKSVVFAWGTVRPPDAAPIPVARIGAELVPLDGVADLRDLIERGPGAWAAVRRQAEASTRRLALEDCEPLLPVAPRDYVDFYASLEHATNLGRMFRPGAEPLAPNWRHMPVAYHGRASTVLVSGTPIRRPRGQLGPGRFGPTERLDLECELGFVVGPSTPPGEPVPIERASERLFGFVLLNDWSARDVQRWETVPLGPFLGKSFATSISPWIVPPDALERVAPRRQEPEPAEYLRSVRPWAVDAQIIVRVNGDVVSRTNPRWLYWTADQMLAHATVNGAALTAGDLFATGTISGPGPGTQGSLIECYGGERWLEDGDEVVLEAEPFGEVRGRILPAA